MEHVTAQTVKKRIEMLRGEMRSNGVDLFLAYSTDPHASEYIADHFKVTEFFSGCTSDNATLLVTEQEAMLWTDGRYFISAAMELEGSGITLMKMGEDGVPTVKDALKKRLLKGDTLGFHGQCLSARDGGSYRKLCESMDVKVDSKFDPASALWVGRPALPCHEVWILDEALSGESFESKLAKVREKMEAQDAAYHVITNLDEIMWLFNIRGADVECNPVALSYALIGRTTADLFLQGGEVTTELSDYAHKHSIKLHEYDTVLDYLKSYHYEGAVLLDPSTCTDAVYELMKDTAEIREGTDPAAELKAVKNPVEIEHLRSAYLLDSVQVCKFLCRMKKKIGSERVTEITAREEMDRLRTEVPGFLDLSFSTISAYGANAAMAHYAPTEEGCAEVKPEGFLLVDSGGQYLGGTTDVTRTIACGPLTEEMRRDFTLVAASNLRLLNARFPQGTSGVHLDILAREKLYRYGLDYNHGTGHGIGYILSVHEGPQNISKGIRKAGYPFSAGMLISDEPGIYKEGRYGIRTETILLCVKDQKTEFGEFLRFEPLTLVPIDRDAIDTHYLEETDLDALNAYHRIVREAVSPCLQGEELAWLLAATEPLSRERQAAR